MRPSIRFAQTVTWISLVSLLAGCSGQATIDGARPVPSAPSLSQEDQDLYQKLESQVSDIISAETQRYAPLQYKYTEGLLEILDQVGRSLSGTNEGNRPRFMTKLDAREELDHLRETVRRWEAKTGKNLRVEVDALKADVAARKPGETVHPEFQSKFSRSFDEFISIEVAEIRDRRNVAIHAAADKLLVSYRDKNPEVVRRIQLLLDNPPYGLPPGGGAGSHSSPPPVAKP